MTKSVRSHFNKKSADLVPKNQIVAIGFSVKK